MKKTLGVVVLILSSLVISAACASSGASPTPKLPQPDSGENSPKAGPSELASRPASAEEVELTLREYAGIVGVQQPLKEGVSL